MVLEVADRGLVWSSWPEDDMFLGRFDGSGGGLVGSEVRGLLDLRGGAASGSGRGGGSSMVCLRLRVEVVGWLGCG